MNVLIMSCIDTVEVYNENNWFIMTNMLELRLLVYYILLLFYIGITDGNIRKIILNFVWYLKRKYNYKNNS